MVRIKLKGCLVGVLPVITVGSFLQPTGATLGPVRKHLVTSYSVACRYVSVCVRVSVCSVPVPNNHNIANEYVSNVNKLQRPFISTKWVYSIYFANSCYSCVGEN